MTIEFNNIPNNIRKPGLYSEYNDSLAVQGISFEAKTMVILGQKLSTGTGVDNVPVKVFGSDKGDEICGAGSVAALAIRAAFTANKNIQLSVVPIPDGAGSAAVGTITISGIASSTGSFVVWVGNVRTEITVNNLDAVNDISEAIFDALVINQANMPVIFTHAAPVITMTAKNKGNLGNNIPVSFLNNNVGTSNLAVVQPTDGATDPAITTALTNIFPADYDQIFCTLNDATNLALLKTHLTNAAAPTEGRRSTGYFGYTGVQATLETLCGTTLNYERMSVGYLPYGKTTEMAHSLDYEVGAAYASIVAKQSDPARPFNGLSLPGIAPSALENQLSRTQQESLLLNGATPLEVGVGSSVNIVRAITTYTQNAAGVKSIAWLDLTSILSMDFGSGAIDDRLALRFPRAKLTDRTVNLVKSQIMDVIRILVKLEIWLSVDEDEVIVEKDGNVIGRINNQIPGKVVPGMHIIANRYDLILN